MIKISQRLQFISAAVVIVGATIKIFHLHSSGDYLLFAGFFASGIGGIIEYIAQTLVTDDINTFCCDKLGLKKFCKPK